MRDRRGIRLPVQGRKTKNVRRVGADSRSGRRAGGDGAIAPTRSASSGRDGADREAERSRLLREAASVNGRAAARRRCGQVARAMQTFRGGVTPWQVPGGLGIAPSLLGMRKRTCGVFGADVDNRSPGLHSPDWFASSSAPRSGLA